jgi:hypothetical protein
LRGILLYIEEEMLSFKELSTTGHRLEKAIDRWTVNVGDRFISNDEYVVLTVARGIVKTVSDRLRKAGVPRCPDVIDLEP